jgi:long-chain acyl-CoA synthetase
MPTRFANITEVVLARSTQHGDQPCLRFYRDEAWQEISWGELGARIRAIAGGLVELGITPGDRVALISRSCPEWTLADLGSLAAGAVVVPVYATLPGHEVVYHLRHSRARIAFVEDRSQTEKITGHELPDLEQVVVLSGVFEPHSKGVMSLAELCRLPSVEQQDDAVWTGLAADRSTAMTIVYTSGTTGVPKGVVLTHGNVLAVIEAVLETLGEQVSRFEVNLSFLPLAHALERVAGQLLPLYLGRTIAYARGLDTLREDFRTIRPEIAVAVPRVFEKIHSRIMSEAQRRPPLLRALFNAALRTGMAYSRALETGVQPGWLLRLRYQLADALVFRKLRAALGGRILLFVSGGAPLSATIARFFHAAGLLICEGWGATETTAPATWNHPQAYRFGSVGKPLLGVEVKVADDGELLVRGANVFSGYYEMPEATAEVLDADGWYHTGDIGHIDDDGFVYVTDRKKELIITAGGKNVAPQKIEGILREQPLISSCMAYGDRRPYLVALMTVDRTALAAGYPELTAAATDDPRLLSLLQEQVAAVNSQLARFEQIKAFRLLEEDFSTDNGELTVTLKLRRKVIAEHYVDLIEEIYDNPDRGSADVK